MAVADLRFTANYYINLEDVEQRFPLMQRLESSERAFLLEGIRILRIILKCSRRQKIQAIKLEIPKRLLEYLQTAQAGQDYALMIELLQTLTSIGTNCQEGRAHLLYLNVPSRLLDLLDSPDHGARHAALGCLRAVFQHPSQHGKVTQILCRRPDQLRRLIDLMDKSSVACEIACDVLTLAPVAGASMAVSEFCLPMPTIIHALASWRNSVKRSCLLFLVSCCQNRTLLPKLIRASSAYQGVLSERVLALLEPTQETEIRVLALNLLTTLTLNDFALCDHPTLCGTVLPLLARLCRVERPINVRTSAAEILATLIDDNPSLQEVASYTDQLMVSLAAFLKMPSLASVTEIRKRRKGEPVVLVTDCGLELKRSCFLVFSALASSSEILRKRVAAVDTLVDVAVKSSVDPNPRLAYAALRLLLCLSRSIQELRTIFKEHKVWETAMSLLKNDKCPSELIVIVSGIVANLGVEFSSCRAEFVNRELWTTLGLLLSHPEEEVVKNVTWTFMNLTYMADLTVKKTVSDCLPIAAVQLLLRHSNQHIVMSTLGLLRNLLHSPPLKEVRSCPANSDITARILRRMRGGGGGQQAPDYPTVQINYAKALDAMETPYSQELVPCLLRLLTESTRAEVLEQCFCALANVCVSSRGRQLILTSKESMDIIRAGLSHSDVRVASTAVTCLGNLALPEEDSKKDEKQYISSEKRQRMLIDMNMMSAMTGLLGTKDEQLLIRVKTVIHHLNEAPNY